MYNILIEVLLCIDFNNYFGYLLVKNYVLNISSQVKSYNYDYPTRFEC